MDENNKQEASKSQLVNRVSDSDLTVNYSSRQVPAEGYNQLKDRSPNTKKSTIEVIGVSLLLFIIATVLIVTFYFGKKSDNTSTSNQKETSVSNVNNSSNYQSSSNSSSAGYKIVFPSDSSPYGSAWRKIKNQSNINSARTYQNSTTKCWAAYYNESSNNSDDEKGLEDYADSIKSSFNLPDSMSPVGSQLSYQLKKTDGSIIDIKNRVYKYTGDYNINYVIRISFKPGPRGSIAIIEGCRADKWDTAQPAFEVLRSQQQIIDL
jgi:hypothetical protein